MKQNLQSFKFIIALLLLAVCMDGFSETVSYTQKATKDIVKLSNPLGAEVTFEVTTWNNEYVQLAEKDGMTYTFSGFDGCTITGITLNMKSNQSAGAGSLNVKVGDKVIAQIKDNKFNSSEWNGAYSTSYVDIEPTISPTLVGVGENIVVTISASANSLYCRGITIEYEPSVTYVAKPDIPESCIFVDSKRIEIVNKSTGAVVYYTTDGTEPSVNSIEYIGPFDIFETTELKAIALKDGNQSEVSKAVYTKSEGSYKISFSVNGTIETRNDKIISYGEVFTEQLLPEVDVPQNIYLKGWSRNANSTEIVDFPLTDVVENTTLYAVFVQPSSYLLVRDVDELKEGDQVVIASSEYKRAISTEELSSYGKPTDVAIKGDILVPTEAVRVFDLGVSDGFFTFKSGQDFLVCPSSDKNELGLQTKKEDKVLWKVVITDGIAKIENKDYKTSYSSRMLQYYSESPRFSCYVNREKPVSIYKRVSSDVISTSYSIVNVSAVGYATLYLDKAVAVPAGVNAYIAKGASGGYLILEQLEGVLPALTGVILEAEEKEYAFLHSSDSEKKISGNLLKGTLANEYVSGAAYVLSNPNNVIGFYAAKLVDGKFLNNANKAYLPAYAISTSAEQQSNGLRFSVGGATGMDYRISLDINAEGEIYDLLGRRVQKMDKGFYIINGRKIVK